MDNSNNTCAPRMADGRLFSDYRSGDVRDDITLAGFSNANEHRHFLQNNADKIMQEHANRVQAKECKSCELRVVAPTPEAEKKAPATNGVSLETDIKRENFDVSVADDAGILGTVIAVGVIGLIYAMYIRK